MGPMVDCVECKRPLKGKSRRGRCGSCYNRLRRELKVDGTFVPEYTQAPPAAERILREAVAGHGGCVLFFRRLSHGYGRVDQGGRTVWAYRAVYEALVGQVPEGKVLDHACHTRDTSCPGGEGCIHRRCVNPHHLEPVTEEENWRRGRSASARNLAKTHCPAGHEYSPDNTIIGRRLGRLFRRCRTCHNEREREAARAKSRSRRKNASGLNSSSAER